MHDNIDTASLLRLLERQKKSWNTVRENYDALAGIITKRIALPGCSITVMHNPARILSTASKPYSKGPNSDSCFLCTEKRPVEQEALPYAGRYSVLVNPYPVFRNHFTIVSVTHTEQRIDGRFGDMLRLAESIPGFTVFYNGPECGASAPHHAHFQAGESGVMPIEDEWRGAAATVTENGTGGIYRLPEVLRNAFVIESGSAGYVETAFNRIYAAAPVMGRENEPMMNILAKYAEGKWSVFVFLRKAHRPSFYGTDGEDKMLVSPASVEMGGLLILPRKEDFVKITESHAAMLYNEVCIDNGETERIISELKTRKI